MFNVKNINLSNIFILIADFNMSYRLWREDAGFLEGYLNTQVFYKNYYKKLGSSSTTTLQILSVKGGGTPQICNPPFAIFLSVKGGRW